MKVRLDNLDSNRKWSNRLRFLFFMRPAAHSPSRIVDLNGVSRPTVQYISMLFCVIALIHCRLIIYIPFLILWYDEGSKDIVSQYIAFNRIVNDKMKKLGGTEEAIREAIRIGKDQDILREYLNKREFVYYRFRNLNISPI